jgi:hypothetical protein
VRKNQRDSRQQFRRRNWLEQNLEIKTMRPRIFQKVSVASIAGNELRRSICTGNGIANLTWLHGAVSDRAMQPLYWQPPQF